MSEKIITSYDIMLAKLAMAYRQCTNKDKVGVVVDDDMGIEWHEFLLDSDDLSMELAQDIAEPVRSICVYNLKSRKKIWLPGSYSITQIGDVVECDIDSNGEYVVVKNFTRPSKEQMIADIDRASRVVFGVPDNKGNCK